MVPFCFFSAHFLKCTFLVHHKQTSTLHALNCSLNLCAWRSLNLCAWRSLNLSHGAVLICAWRSLNLCAWRSLNLCAWRSLNLCAWRSLNLAHGAVLISAHGAVLISAHGAVLISAHGAVLIFAHGAVLIFAHGAVLISAHGAVLISAHGAVLILRQVVNAYIGFKIDRHYGAFVNLRARFYALFIGNRFPHGQRVAEYLRIQAVFQRLFDWLPPRSDYCSDPARSPCASQRFYLCIGRQRRFWG